MADYTPVKGFFQGNALESVPDLSTLTSEGYPTNGDPRKGVPATVPGAAWYYWIEQMLRAVCSASGKEAANPPSPTELLAALKTWAWADDSSLPLAKLSVGVVSVTKQSFTEAEQKQARANVGLPGFFTEVITTNGGSVPV